MKTRTLSRLRRALKKRQTAPVKRALDIAAARHAAEYLESGASPTAPYERIQRRIAGHFEQRAKETIREVLTSLDFNNTPPPTPPPALYPVDPQADIGPAISPKPTGGALLAAMLTGKKA